MNVSSGVITLILADVETRPRWLQVTLRLRYTRDLTSWSSDRAASLRLPAMSTELPTLENRGAAPSISTSEQWLVLAAAFLGWMFDGLEMGIFPLVARPALQQLMRVHDDRLVGLWMGYVTALFLVGAAIGGLLFGW